MKIVVISDTHGLHHTLEVPTGDIIIHAGDFSKGRSKQSVLDFILWFKQLNFKYKILTAGNHDFYVEKNQAEFIQLLGKDIVFLKESGTSIEGIKFWGSPIQPDLVGWAFGKRRGDQMKLYWDLMPGEIDILVTHTPPYGILDQSSSGSVLGCEELAKKVNLIQPKYHIFGHIHAGYGLYQQNKTTFVNAANMNSRRGLINPPIIIEYNY